MLTSLNALKGYNVTTATISSARQRFNPCNVSILNPMLRRFIFASESVGEGHPDKVCDTISDAVLDACLRQDRKSRVACETYAKSNVVVVGGEITIPNLPKGKHLEDVIPINQIVRDTVREIGYVHDDDVFHAKKIFVNTVITDQSHDISQGVDAKKAKGKEGAEQGAGDPGVGLGSPREPPRESEPARRRGLRPDLLRGVRRHSRPAVASPGTSLCVGGRRGHDGRAWVHASAGLGRRRRETGGEVVGSSFLDERDPIRGRRARSPSIPRRQNAGVGAQADGGRDRARQRTRPASGCSRTGSTCARWSSTRRSAST